MFELFRNIDEDFRGSISWNTQPKCRVIFNITTALLSPFFLDLRLAVRQPGDVHMRTFHQTCNRSWSCRTSILEDAICHRMDWYKFLLGNPCRAIETFYHWDFPLGLRVLDAFFTLCRVEELGEGFGCVDFARLLIS